MYKISRNMKQAGISHIYRKHERMNIRSMHYASQYINNLTKSITETTIQDSLNPFLEIVEDSLHHVLTYRDVPGSIFYRVPGTE